MTRLEDRQSLIREIAQAPWKARGWPQPVIWPASMCARCNAGRAMTACRAVIAGRMRIARPRACVERAERARIVAVANEPRFAATPPARIVPILADEGIYIASESSFNRVLRAHGQMNRRGRAQPPRTSRPPTTHIATAPAESGAGM